MFCRIVNLKVSFFIAEKMLRDHERFGLEAGWGDVEPRLGSPVSNKLLQYRCTNVKKSEEIITCIK